MTKDEKYLGSMLTFKKEVEGPLYVSYYPRIRFFASSMHLLNREFDIEPLTLSRFVRAILVNLYYVNHWKLMRFLIWRCNAFATEPNMMVSWKEFKPFLRVVSWLRSVADLFQKIGASL